METPSGTKSRQFPGGTAQEAGRKLWLPVGFDNLTARAAAHESWAKTPDRTARTEAARAAALAKLETEVDPDGLMSPLDRRKAAENLRKARLLRAAQKSADDRAFRREADRAARRAAAKRAAGES